MLRIIRRVSALLSRKEKRRIPPLLIMMIAGALIDSLSITLIVPFVSSIIGIDVTAGGKLHALVRWLGPESGTEAVFVRSLLFLILLFWIKNAYLQLQRYVQFGFTAAIRERIQTLLMHYYMTRPYPFYLAEDQGEILRTVSTDSDHFFSILNCILQFFTGAIVCAVMTACIFFLNPEITVVLGLILAAVYLLAARVIRPLLGRYGLLYREELGKANAILIETLRGIKTVKLYGKEGFFEHRYRERMHSMIHATRMERTFRFSSRLLIEAGAVSGMLLYLLLKTRQGGDVQALIPVLSAFVIAASRLLPCMSDVSSALSQVGFFEGALTRVENIFRLTREETANRDTEPEQTSRVTMEKGIDLERVSFSYPERKERVLDEACLSVRKHEFIGIVGPSGAGKTTLVDLILGLLQPQGGQILLDGIPADTAAPAWRNLFAYIPQKIFILNGSVLDNVAFGVESGVADEDRAWRAIERAQLSAFVRSLPEGIRTRLGEAGAALSGGQAQRLAIARAFYRDPPVFVFDEATTSLDAPTEQALLAEIGSLRGEKTVILISHREEILKDCDAIYTVENGKIERRA